MAALRADVQVPNESDGFVFTSRSMRGRGISPGDEGWGHALSSGDLVPLAVESEDPANVRVVVNGELTPAEAEEWVGQVRTTLRVPDGVLALCGGSVYVMENGHLAEEFVRTLAVPAGDYDATLYAYASAPNGLACLERAGVKAIGAWFRQTRPGEKMPAWLHNMCVNDPELDPGHAPRWKRMNLKKGPQVVDFLLHLVASSGGSAKASVDDTGFLEMTDCRRPEPFPLGIPTVSLLGGEKHDEEAGEEEDDAPRPVVAVDVRSRSEPLDRRPVATGPVAVPVVKLARVARLAWMCHPYAHPQLRVTFPGQVPKRDEVEGVAIVAKGRALEIGFEDTGQPAGAAAALTAVAKQLASAPDGTVVELDTSRAGTKDRTGLHRYRGTVQGGAWRIAEAYPVADAVRLQEALALAEALENGRRLTARDEAEAEAIVARVTGTISDYFGSNGIERTGAEVALKRRDPQLFDHVVSRVFWMRYAGIWPLMDQDER